MDASAWRAVDQILGVAELLLVPASVIYLVVALARLGRAKTLRALAVVGVTALVVAQPFGVKGIPISPEEFRADNPRQVDAEAIHSVRELGIPIFGFRPYRVPTT